MREGYAAGEKIAKSPKFFLLINDMECMKVTCNHAQTNSSYQDAV